MIYDVPEVGKIEIKTLVLDLNGTLSIKGVISDVTREKIKELLEKGVNVILFTGDQRGTALNLCDELGINFIRCKNSAEKKEAMKKFNKETTASIGNARIDIGTFEESRISVATVQAEGIHTGIISHVDVIVPSIEDALDFFLDKDTFAATMRT